jgi:hypothetical protein
LVGSIRCISPHKTSPPARASSRDACGKWWLFFVRIGINGDSDKEVWVPEEGKSARAEHLDAAWMILGGRRVVADQTGEEAAAVFCALEWLTGSDSADI